MLAACSGSDSTGTGGSDRVASVELSQRTLTVGVGSTVTLTAVVRDASGREIANRGVVWTTSDTLVARVSNVGVVSTLRTGNVQIAATVEGKSAVSNVTIAPKTVASVQVDLTNVSLIVGESRKLNARPLDDTGAPLAGRQVTWSSSDVRVATVDTSGVVTGLAPGVATLTARSESRSVAVGVSVSLVPVARVDLSPMADTIVVGQTTQFTAVARDAAGGALADRQSSWSTSNVSVATVSSSGLATGVSPGTSTISVANSGRIADAQLVVLPRPVGAVIVSPGQVALRVGEQVRLTVQVTDDNGNLLVGRAVQYRSDNTGIATVAADGTVRGVAAGNTEIVVTSEGRSSRVTVSITPVPVASITLSASTLDLVVGGTARVTAQLKDAAGAVLANRPVTWTSGAPGVAEVDGEGNIRAIGPGSAIIIASSEGRTATVSVNVRGVPVGAVVVSPDAASMFVGDDLDLSVLVRDEAGAVLQGRNVLWTSSDERVALVSSSGRVRALAVGTVRITASVDGVNGTSTITVSLEPVLSIAVTPTPVILTLPSATAQLTATTRGRSDVVLTGRTITFTSSDPTIAAVSATGLVTGFRAGTTTITVASEGKTTVVPVTVNAAQIASITVSLAASSVVAGTSTNATAVLRDGIGGVLTGRSISWSSSNTSVATVSPTGAVTTLAAGTTTITATADAQSGSATLTVTAPPPTPVSTVSVSLSPTSVVAGGTSTATAITRSASGTVLTGRVVTWATSDATIATVNSSGAVTTLKAGTVSVTATSEGRSGSATLIVTAPPPVPVATVAVSLAAASVVAGGSTTATAIVRDAAGATLTGRTVTWSTSDPTIATVNGSGAVATLKAGTVSVTATSEGQTGSATLTVTAPSPPPPAGVATVAVSLAATSVVAGASTSATAVLRDASGSVLTGRTVAWSTSDGTVATVSQTGAITTLKAGSVAITATSEGRTGSATLTVTAPPPPSPAPVATVSVSLANASIVEGTTTAATATLRDASGATLTGRVVAWSTSSAAIATVSADGTVTSTGPGTATITATSEGRTGSATVSVQQVPVARVTVTPSSATIDEDGPQSGRIVQLTATAYDAQDRVLTGRTFTWSSSRPQVATVSTTGLVRAVDEGSTVITVSTGGRSATSSILVRD
ncbi:MAG TPA: Ig-like domain-containing protein [Gemmatimonas sp.]|nr:Ig-like domain-containing protein [Gemmatimonas sp.]